MERQEGSRWALVACYTVELLALAIWVGGLVAIIVTVIPAVFTTMGIEPGGRFLTRVFNGYNRLIWYTIAVLLVGMVARILVQAKTNQPEDLQWRAIGAIESGLFLAMVLIAVLISFVLGPESVRLQEQAFAAQGETAKHVAYDAFFHAHNLVRGCYLANLVLGVALTAIKVRGWATPHVLSNRESMGKDGL